MTVQSIESRSPTSDDIGSLLQKLISKVSEDLEKRRYNTAIASMMEFTNAVAGDTGVISVDDAKTFAQLLAPFAPHVTEEIWSMLNGYTADGYTKKQSIHTSTWPVPDSSRIRVSAVTIIVQVNGKVRDMLELRPEISLVQSDVDTAARASAKIQAYLDGKTVRKVIFVPGKLSNFVVS